MDPTTREIVIDRVMALDTREVDVARIRWVVLMVLFNQPDKKSSLALLQDMILADAFDVLH
jgi:Smg protein